MWDLVPWPGIKPRPPALGAQGPSHWTPWEVLSRWSWKPLPAPGSLWFWLMFPHIKVSVLLTWERPQAPVDISADGWILTLPPHPRQPLCVMVNACVSPRSHCGVAVTFSGCAWGHRRQPAHSLLVSPGGAGPRISRLRLLLDPIGGRQVLDHPFLPPPLALAHPAAQQLAVGRGRASQSDNPAGSLAWRRESCGGKKLSSTVLWDSSLVFGRIRPGEAACGGHRGRTKLRFHPAWLPLWLRKDSKSQQEMSSCPRFLPCWPWPRCNCLPAPPPPQPAVRSSRRNTIPSVFLPWVSRIYAVFRSYWPCSSLPLAPPQGTAAGGSWPRLWPAETFRLWTRICSSTVPRGWAPRYVAGSAVPLLLP